MPAISKAAMAEAAKLAAAEEGEIRQRAARQAAAQMDKPDPIATAECRVLKLGDGKISMGKHAPGIGDAHYEKGESFTTLLPIAQGLEEKGYVEITATIEPEADAG